MTLGIREAGNRYKSSYLRYSFDAKGVDKGFGRFLAGHDYGTKLRQLCHKVQDIGRHYHLEVFVGGIVAQTTYGGGGVEERNASLLAMGDDGLEPESLLSFVYKVQPVTIKHLSLDAPMIIDIVGIIKIETPPLSLRWETAQKQHLRLLRKEGAKGMPFHIGRGDSNVFGIEPGLHWPRGYRLAYIDS